MALRDFFEITTKSTKGTKLIRQQAAKAAGESTKGLPEIQLLSNFALSAIFAFTTPMKSWEILFEKAA